ncbi:MAG: heparinase II/III family protein [Lentisphaerae bacterium]|nr:heparinase II/III family protein [Lentisphaerota bacterium]
MSFAFGCAKKLYKDGVHPRVVIGPADLERLRIKIKTGDGRKIMAGLRQKVRPIVECALSADLRKELAVSPDLSLIRWTIFDLAMVGILDGCAKTLEAAKRALLAVPAAFGSGGESNAAVFSIKYGCHPLAYDLLYDRLAEAERAAYADWVVNACVRPAVVKARPNYYKNAGANTPIAETLPALLGWLAVKGDPGVPDLAAEEQELLSLLRASLHAAFTADGYPEEDIGYGTAVAGGLAQSVEPLRRAGLYDAYSDCPRYARIGAAALHFVQPWGLTLSNTGDYGDSFLCRELILGRQARQTSSPALAWLLGALSCAPAIVKAHQKAAPAFTDVLLRKGFRVPATALSLIVMDCFKGAVHPAKAGVPTQFRDRGRGIVSLRSGWGEEDTLVVFDGSQRSPAAQGHAHSSCGHFSISALGEYFAVDSGRYNMEQNCHNVVLIDGQSGRSTEGEWQFAFHHGLLTDYLPGEFVDFAAVDSSHQHNCYWARRYLGLVKGKGAPAYVWTVEDINKANDWAEFWWQLHTSPENTITIYHAGRMVQGPSASIKGWRKGNRLDAHFVLPAPTSYPRAHTIALTQDVASSSSYKYVTNPEQSAAEHIRPSDMLHRSLFVRPRLLAKVGGYNGRFMALMLPRRNGAKPAKVERLPSVDNSLAVRIAFGEVEDILIFAYEHNLLEADGIIGRGQWCVVRRNQKSKRVIGHALGHGTSLRVAGTELARGSGYSRIF